MSKADLRIKVRAVREGLSDDMRRSATESIQRHAIKLLQKVTGSIGLYMPCNYEVSPVGIMHHLTQRTFAFPVVGNDLMHFHQWDDTAAHSKNKYGITEIITQKVILPDIIITPLLGIDRYGTRLGYGKGYYDRYFATDGNNALRIGLAFSAQLMHKLPYEAHDIALHATITERGIMRHKQRIHS